MMFQQLQVTAERVARRLFSAMADLSRPQKRGILMLNDAVLCIIAVWFAFSLRMGEWYLFTRPVIIVIVVALACWLPIFLARGVYSTIVRFSGGRTMVGLANSVVFFAMPMIAIFMLNSISGVPRTVAIIHPLTFLFLLGVSRIVARYALIELLHRDQDGTRSAVLIYGAGTAGQQLALSMQHEPRMKLFGFIDDDKRLDGQRLDGIPVYYSSKLPEVIAAAQISDVLLAMPSLTRARRKRIVEGLEEFNVHVRTLPNIRQVMDGNVSLTDLRPVQIEDLLGRDPVPPNALLLGRTVVGRTVMVTGAGGSIGSELVRQIALLRPRKLVMVELSEYGLYAVEQEVRSLLVDAGLADSIELVPELANVADRDAVRRMLRRWRPETIFHAAAYKHVPLVEANPVSGIKNNVFGTFNMAVEAEASGVGNFILISTDKAVRPTNIMGASKRVCEMVLQALAARGTKTCFTMVRFGNVLGSSGSVVPRFQQQIAAGGPVTLTHRNVTRYFMTIPEAAQLVIQAGAMAKGGEVFVLDMGQSVKIIDLARSMIRLSGLTVRDDNNPDGDIEIAEVGLRPGEKMYEELLIGDAPQATKHARIMQAREEMLEWDALTGRLSALTTALEAGSGDDAIAIVAELVPGYAPPADEAASSATG